MSIAALLLVAGLSADPPAKPAEPDLREIQPTLRYDAKKKQVIIEAEVGLREGSLELLLCPRRTKEHESILVADIDPKAVQIALLLIGATPGAPASLVDDKIVPPSGEKLTITLVFEQDGKTKKLDARQWIRRISDQKELAADFVFAGSRLVRQPGQEQVRFLAEEGDVICVVNFPGSIIDIAQDSSKDNNALLFEAWTDRIPPTKTKVQIIIEAAAKPPTPMP